MKRKLFSCLAFAFGLAATAQSSLLFNINKSGDSNPDQMFLFDGKIYFQADTGDATSDYAGGNDIGDELWVLDPSDPNNPSLSYIDIVSGSDNSSPEYFFTLNNQLYFNQSVTNVPHVLNGTGDGADPVSGLVDASVGDLDDMVELNGVLYFINNASNKELWQWDGTTNLATRVPRANTNQVESLDSFNSRTSYSTQYINVQAHNDKIYFTGNVSESGTDSYGVELYEYDPATDLFTRLTDLPGDATDETSEESRIYNIVFYDNQIYFARRDTTAPGQFPVYLLYRTNGTTTEEVTSASNESTYIRPFCVWKNELYLGGEDSNGFFQLYKYNASNNTTTQISTNTTKDHNPYRFVTPDDNDDYLYYNGETDSSSSDNLHRTNGTTTEVLDENVHLSWPAIKVGDILYFEGDNGSGDEIYKLDLNTLSVSDVKLKGITGVYPNPAKDFIMVDKTLVDAAYSIYDITGKVVKQGVLKSQRLDFNLNTGLYIFKAQTDLGFFAQKIIVK
ncbi:T9SS type A sorting domain-containing protein [Aestuariibaculum sp. YM273]|uniref:T9SS type A sorting domain-containing protein n=1 Tax=Aestuariibaculum sp. YM273 TaxID=3070659 RepID=UPI0027DD63F5|nr:T9SS type A sorting domain-containing protein [Aestuariibaculum sp. YM273]WMI64425.1 T9SS type A sorting domain-containing protein [Aestuariibaculum sp. YM273]